KEIVMGVLKKVAGTLVLVTGTLAAARGFQADPAAIAVDPPPPTLPLPRVADGAERDPAIAGAAGREQDEPLLATKHTPRPWETVVRIQIHDERRTGLGSGTVIQSTSAESLILTGGRMFKDDHAGNSPRGAYRQRVTVQLFDGKPLDSPRAQMW